MITVDKEFESMIPPLSSEEFAQLEENCVKDGIRDPLVVWELPDGDILVDGHNRWKISAKHAGIRFNVVKMHFENRDAAKEWILKNQLGRRNLPSYVRAQLALRLKPIIAEKAKKRQLDAPQISGEQKKEIKKIWETYPFETARNLVADKEQEYAAERRRERTRSEKQIYFARFGGDKLKVGSSTDPEGRIQTLRVANPDLQLVKIVFFGEGAEKHENSLKKKFHEYQIANECYQCSDDVLNQMIEYTVKESTRKDSTDRQLATIAGVSHDTIHKVEVVEKHGTPEIKAKARSGEISTNEAYRQTTNIMRPIKKDDIVKQAEEEHADFIQKKTEAVVSLRDAAVDAENKRILALELSKRTSKAFNAIQNITLFNDDLKGIISALTAEEKHDVKKTIDTCISCLSILREMIGG